ncbi:hypothetical protein RchiOBHm_Chr1g0319341 [Rosa chinensis]|uniref:Uncharacterized protein n=1 Tax=Rosa chinensis TaxID=74649 RepID=A0A2P6S8H6_ROSCH|nr:hypothetical protein RchiOBHm_Chr1g0319341 [Rosa chinensis]
MRAHDLYEAPALNSNTTRLPINSCYCSQAFSSQKWTSLNDSLVYMTLISIKLLHCS